MASLHHTSSLCAVPNNTELSFLAYPLLQGTTTAEDAPVYVTEGPPVVRLPRVRSHRETECPTPSQHSCDPLYVVRLPETSICNRQGIVGPSLDTIVYNPRHTGPQRASSDKMAEIVQFFFFSAVERFPDVPLIQEWQQNYPETLSPPLHVSESIVADTPLVGTAPVDATHSTTADIQHPIPTAPSPIPKPPKQMIDPRICLDWLYGRCYHHPCKFLHPEFFPPQTHGYNIVGYSKRHFTPLS
jgi:hypothetical protein